MNTLSQITKPDDCFVWTKEEAEKEMPGFQFKGSGWYIRPEAAMVAFPAEGKDDFHFWVYYGRDPRSAFQLFFLLPVHLDLPVNTKQRQWNIALMLGNVVLFIAGFIVGLRFGFMWQLPILLALAVWNIYFRKVVEKRS